MLILLPIHQPIAQSKSVHLSARVQMLEAEVAAQRGREEEAMERERRALARVEELETRDDLNEMAREVEARVQEVKEEERAARAALEEQVHCFL